MRYQDRQFSTLLNAMPDVDGFRPSYLRVFLALHRLENAVSGTTQPAQSVLARNTGLHRVTINRAVAWLRLNGFIKTVQRFRKLLSGLGYRFLSLKYWVAKELGQVSFLERIEKMRRVQKWLKQGRFSCSLGATPPSNPVSYSATFMSPDQKTGALDDRQSGQACGFT